MDSSYTSLTGVKKVINHCNKEHHIWSYKRPRSAIGAWLCKSYSVNISPVMPGFHTSDLFSRQTFFRGVHRVIVSRYDVIITWLWRRRHLSRHRLFFSFSSLFLDRLTKAFESTFYGKFSRKHVTNIWLITWTHWKVFL